MVEQQHCATEFCVWLGKSGSEITHPSSLRRQRNDTSCGFQVVEVL